MASVNVVDVVESLYDRLPGIPEATLARAYIYAARRFLTVVQAHALEVNTWAVPSDFAVYTPATLPADSEIVDATDARLSKQPLTRSTRSQTNNFGVDPTAIGAPRFYEINATSVRLTPTPLSDVSAELYARLILRPVAGAATIDDVLVRDYFEPFEFGALQYVHALPGHALTDLKVSSFYGVQFQDKIDYWSVRAVDGGVGNIRTTRYHAPGRR